MNNEVDLKKLWQKQPVDEKPEITELLRKANLLTRRSRFRLILYNVVLFVTVGVLVTEVLVMHETAMTTRAGVALMILAMLSYLAVYNQLLPTLFKTNLQNSTQEYLNQLLTIKRKEEFLNKVMINIYFVMLSLGLALDFVKFVETSKPVITIPFCIVTYGFIGFAWFYSRPRRIKCMQKSLNETIEKLEKINGQLSEED